MIDNQHYIICQSFGTLTKFMMQKRFLDFSDSLFLGKKKCFLLYFYIAIFYVDEFVNFCSFIIDVVFELT